MRMLSVGARAWLALSLVVAAVTMASSGTARAVVPGPSFATTAAAMAAQTAPVTLGRGAVHSQPSGPVPLAFAPGEAQRARAYIEVRRMRSFVMTRQSSAEAEIEHLEAIQRELQGR